MDKTNGIFVPVITGILETVENSGCLGNSPRLHDLLAYLLRESEAGRADRVKAYSIAVDVLGRPEDFDTSIDSIVRVEMHRLRKGLALFNAGNHPFMITIPKASYKIHITQKTNDKPPATKSILTIRNLLLANLIILLLFLAYLLYAFSTNNTDQPILALDKICTSSKPHAILEDTKIVGTANPVANKAVEINAYLRSGLSQYSKIAFIPENVDCSFREIPSYLIQSTLFNTTSIPFVNIDVYEIKSQSTIYSQKVYLTDPEIAVQQQESALFYRVASQIAHASGVIPNDATIRDWGSNQDKKNYTCLTSAYQYFVTNSKKEYLPALAFLEESVKTPTLSADLLGLLAIFYIEQDRGYQDYTVSDPLDIAEQLLERAQSMSPFTSEVLIGYLRLESERDIIGVEKIKNILEIIERQHPQNAHVLIIASQTAGFKIGSWEYARELSNRTINLSHSNSYAVYFVEAAYALLFSDNETAFKHAQTIYSKNSPLAIIMNIAAANKVGELSKVNQYKVQLHPYGMYTTNDYVDFINNRKYEPKLTAELIKWVQFEP